MSPKANKRNKNRRKARRMHPWDRDRLIMDSIYCSKIVEVQDTYRRVMQEETARFGEQLERGDYTDFIEQGGDMSTVRDDFDRIHMRMGVRYFDMLSPTMQKHFLAEYPDAFTMFGDEAPRLRLRWPKLYEGQTAQSV